MLLFLLPTAITVFAILSFNTVRGDLTDPNTKNSYINRLRSPWYADNYKAALSYALGRLDKLFGAKLLSARGYLVCTVVSFAYGLYGFLLAWSFGGPGKIGETILLPENWPLEDRQEFAFALISISIVLYIFTAAPLAALQLLRRFLRRQFSVSFYLRTNIAFVLLFIGLMLVNATTEDGVLVGLLIISGAVLGVWLSSMVFFGAGLIGYLAAIMSGLGSNGAHRFLAAIAIVSVVALGASRGVGPVAALITRRYHRPFSKFFGIFLQPTNAVRLYEAIFPTIVFAVVGASGGGVFVAAVARTYSYLGGPEIDAALVDSLGFPSTSPLLTFAGAIAGLIGGALAARLGQWAVVASSIVSAVLLIVILSTRVLSGHKLPEYFGAGTFVGSAMINILLFFVILAPLNAVWDWLAWDFSRACGRRLIKGPTPSGLVLHTVGIFAVGIILLVGLTASAAEAIGIFNHWMFAHTKTIPLPIDGLAKATADNPFSAEGLWVTTMVLSTLLPTLCHFVMVLFGALFIRTPLLWREKLSEIIASPSSSAKLTVPVLYFTFLPLFGVALVWFLGFISFRFLSFLGAPISAGLYRLVHWLAS